MIGQSELSLPWPLPLQTWLGFLKVKKKKPSELCVSKACKLCRPVEYVCWFGFYIVMNF